MSDEFLSGFQTLIIDECHTSKANSIKKIISKCKSSVYRFGVSGTIALKENFAEYLTIQSYLGPLIQKISPDFLFKNNYATPVNVKIVVLDYLSEKN